ncbi:MAG: aldehyde dehydrogenase family protein [Peptococcales bacterium]|jgi:acyl-CoA reductase-like NAD-dependent aldehyde dehydrogenase
MKHYKFFIDGQWVDSAEKKEVINKYTGQPFATIAQSTSEDVEKAVQASKKSFEKIKLTPYKRYEILLKTSKLLLEKETELAEILCKECGKPIGDSRIEVQRAAQTFEIAAEEAKRIHGEMVPIEASPGSENRLAFTIRVPVGVVCAITPFNVPLNLIAHKIAPAIAAGNTVVLKPTQETPIVAVKLVEILLEAGLPTGHINLLLGSGSTIGEALLQNPEINFYSFTGSPKVGERIKQVIGLRKCTLELGSNSAVIVHKDFPDIKKAAVLCAQRSFANAGQVCISVQRIYVHSDIYEKFLNEMKSFTETLVVGDPMDEKTNIGPMISEKEVERIDQWVQEALKEGAKLVAGGEKVGTRIYKPTILSDVKNDMKVVCMETFAPIAIVVPYNKIEEAIEHTNNSEFGLQAGIFTSDINVAMKAAKEIETGGVIINDTSMYRADAMPYGGVKKSGTGKEGPKYVIEEMTEEKIIVFNL